MVINGKSLSKSAFIKEKSSQKHNRNLISDLTDELITFLSKNSDIRTTCSRQPPVSTTFADGKVKLQLTLWGASKSTNQKAKNVCFNVNPNATLEELNQISDEINRLWSWRIENARPNFDMNALTIPNTPALSDKIEPYVLTKAIVAKASKKHLKTTAHVVMRTIGKKADSREKDLLIELIEQSTNDLLWTFDKRLKTKVESLVSPSCHFYQGDDSIHFRSEPLAKGGRAALGLEQNTVNFPIKETRDLDKSIAIIAAKLLIAKLSANQPSTTIHLTELFDQSIELATKKITNIVGKHSAMTIINMRKAIESAVPEAMHFKQGAPAPSRLSSPKLNLLSEKVNHYTQLNKAIRMVNDGIGKAKIPVDISDIEMFKNEDNSFYSDMIVFANLDQKCRLKQNFEGLYTYVNLTTPDLGVFKPTICHYCKSEPTVYFEPCEQDTNALYSIHCDNGCHDTSYSVEGSYSEATDVAVRWTIANLSYYNPVHFRYHSVDYVRCKEGVDAATRHLKALEAYLVAQNKLFTMHQKYGSTRTQQILKMNSRNGECNTFTPSENLIKASAINLKWAKMNVDLI